MRKFVVAYSLPPLETLFFSRLTGAAVNWAGAGIAYPYNRLAQGKCEVIHYESRESAESVGFSLAARSPDLYQRIEVRQCDAEDCPVCHD